MPQDRKALPERANLDWLRKTAKQNLASLRAAEPTAKLADAQLALARAYGFPSWRALKAQVDAAEAPSDAIVAALLRAVGDGRIDEVRASLAAAPSLVNILRPASCRRAPATGPPSGLFALIRAMQAGTPAPGA